MHQALIQVDRLRIHHCMQVSRVNGSRIVCSLQIRQKPGLPCVSWDLNNRNKTKVLIILLRQSSPQISKLQQTGSRY